MRDSPRVAAPMSAEPTLKACCRPIGALRFADLAGGKLSLNRLSSAAGVNCRRSVAVSLSADSQ